MVEDFIRFEHTRAATAANVEQTQKHFPLSDISYSYNKAFFLIL